ncbi:MAG TPA: enoyl-CoA hydratase [Azospira sp.]|nr:enoyl-CoA hydratase [Azospira sp.]
MSTVLARVEDGVLTLTLNRPESLNALNLAMIADLKAATAQAELDDAVGAVIIRGGEHFMAGGDLKWFHSQLVLPPAERQPLFEQTIAAVHATTLQIRRMGKPVIASVNGAAAGFGLSLMLACDLAVAADTAYFTLAYCHIALSPDGGATWFLPRAVGAKRAAEIALLGDRFDAQQALNWGLLNRVVAAAELEGETAKLARRLAAGPREALARTKALLQASSSNSLPEQLFAEQANFAACAVNPDFAEGLGAFLEKRKPSFA